LADLWLARCGLIAAVAEHVSHVPDALHRATAIRADRTTALASAPSGSPG
jgi:hypothetical protein